MSANLHVPVTCKRALRHCLTHLRHWSGLCGRFRTWPERARLGLAGALSCAGAWGGSALRCWLNPPCQLAVADILVNRESREAGCHDVAPRHTAMQHFAVRREQPLSWRHTAKRADFPLASCSLPHKQYAAPRVKVVTL